MKKDSVKGYALVGIIFILITVVSLAIPTSKSAAFWIAYIFTVVALAAQIVLWKRTFGHKELKSKFLGFPIVHIGIVYLVVQITVLFIFVFAEKLPKGGLLVINSSIENINEITSGLPCRIVTFGKDLSSMYTAQNITYDEFARPSYDLVVQGEIVNRITLGVTGEHNVYNSLAAIAVAMELGIGFDAIMSGLKNFKGTDRRFEKKGEIGGVTIIDDYAHHPQEIAATLSAAKNYPHKKLWCVFQPHTYTRTKAFLDEFAQALSAADEVILADIYAARETDTLGVSSADIASRIEKLGTPAHYIPSFDEIETFILEHCMQGDVLITMGAGDIVNVGEHLLGR